MQSIRLRDDYITLASALKVAGVAGTGGQAKIMVREGIVTVNGTTESRPGKKLVAGDRFAVDGNEWVLEQ